MKPYPTEAFILDQNDLGPRETVYVPTKEAIQNFESYLDPEELAKYNAASDIAKLHIALSVNPFVAFKYILGEESE